VVPTLFSLGSVAVLYLIGKRLWGDAVAVTGSAIMVLSPMFDRFSQLLDNEPVVTFFILSGLYLYMTWMRTGADGYFKAMVAAIVVGCFVDWPAYYMIALIAAHNLLFFGARDERRIRLLVAVGVSFVKPKKDPALGFDPLVLWDTDFLEEERRWIPVYCSLILFFLGLLVLCACLPGMLTPK